MQTNVMRPAIAKRLCSPTVHRAITRNLCRLMSLSLHTCSFLCLCYFMGRKRLEFKPANAVVTFRLTPREYVLRMNHKPSACFSDCVSKVKVVFCEAITHTCLNNASEASTKKNFPRLSHGCCIRHFLGFLVTKLWPKLRKLIKEITENYSANS